ncbi:hypothetical protein A3Q56_01842 [Intoshia linei]|uniref:polynucleotide adenylyltransferase n=1 Tax=Intoshia linei TaxID=1819745 RepID=A0A177BA55_9BILA|nr:hypothetical protein A3Q56_01842 [Intoshia linei]
MSSLLLMKSKRTMNTRCSTFENRNVSYLDIENPKNGQNGLSSCSDVESDLSEHSNISANTKFKTVHKKPQLKLNKTKSVPHLPSCSNSAIHKTYSHQNLNNHRHANYNKNMSNLFTKNWTTLQNSKYFISNEIKYELASTSSITNSMRLNNVKLNSIMTPSPNENASVDFNKKSIKFLSQKQKFRLANILTSKIPIHGKGDFPTIDVELMDFITKLADSISSSQINLNGVRLNGTTASYILANPDYNNTVTYTDIDLIFCVDLSDSQAFELVRTAVFETLLSLIEDYSMSINNIIDAYVVKMLKIDTPSDCWSLIALSNNLGRNLEIKFVDKIQRQFEFSVDSFQIELMPLLKEGEYEFNDMDNSVNSTSSLSSSLGSITFNDVNSTLKPNQEPRDTNVIRKIVYSNLYAESVYGNFNIALYHLNHKMIVTRAPENIRGGGLLKYVSLVLQNYRFNKYNDINNLIIFMCSRFFIDFKKFEMQRIQIEKYISSHFIGNYIHKKNYLECLYYVIRMGSMCLMPSDLYRILAFLEMGVKYCLYVHDTIQHYPILKDYFTENIVFYYSNGGPKIRSSFKTMLNIDQILNPMKTTFSPFQSPYSDFSNIKTESFAFIHVPPLTKYYGHVNLQYRNSFNQKYQAYCGQPYFNPFIPSCFYNPVNRGATPNLGNVNISNSGSSANLEDEKRDVNPDNGAYPGIMNTRYPTPNVTHVPRFYPVIPLYHKYNQTNYLLNQSHSSHVMRSNEHCYEPGMYYTPVNSNTINDKICSNMPKPNQYK